MILPLLFIYLTIIDLSARYITLYLKINNLFYIFRLYLAFTKFFIIIIIDNPIARLFIIFTKSLRSI